jgi:hypothetical protein
MPVIVHRAFSNVRDIVHVFRAVPIRTDHTHTTSTLENGLFSCSGVLTRRMWRTVEGFECTVLLHIYSFEGST